MTVPWISASYATPGHPNNISFVCSILLLAFTSAEIGYRVMNRRTALTEA